MGTGDVNMGSNPNFKLGNSKTNIDLNQFKGGIKIGDSTKELAIFDLNKDGKIDANEAKSMRAFLENRAGNDSKLSTKELEQSGLFTKGGGQSVLDAIQVLYGQQVDLQQAGEEENSFESHFNTDSNGRTIDEHKTISKKDGITSTKYRSADGVYLETVEKREGNSNVKYEYTSFDENDRAILDKPDKKIINEGLATELTISYTYNDDGTVTEITTNSADDVVSTVVKDAEGNEITTGVAEVDNTIAGRLTEIKDAEEASEVEQAENTPETEKPQGAENKPYNHEVKPGDTWYGIVQAKYGITDHKQTMEIVRQLKAHNDVKPSATNMPSQIELPETVMLKDGKEIQITDKDAKVDQKHFAEKPKVEVKKQEVETDKLAVDKYSMDNLIQKYPEDKFEIIQNEEFIGVLDKKTGNKVLGIVKFSSGEIAVAKYDKNGKEIEFIEENANGIMIGRSTKDPDTGEYLTIEEFNEDGIMISQSIKDPKTGEYLTIEEFNANGVIRRSTKFHKDKDGNNQSVTTDYIKGEPHKVSSSADGGVPKYPLAEAIKEDIYSRNSLGLPTTGKNIGKNIEKINSANVEDILSVYEKITGGKESLVSAILAEYGLPIEERMKYVMHIKQAIIEDAKNNNRYTDDISSKFDSEVKHQMEKIGFSDSEYLDSYINKLHARRPVSNTDLDSKPNGKIDADFQQGNTGNCWLLAAINSIAQTPKGLALLNDSISVDDKGNTIVKLEGVGKSYVITPEELAGNNQFSTGDADIRAIEIAMDRYFMEERGVNGRIDLDGNMPNVAYKLLTGKGGRNAFSNSYGRIPEKWFSDSQIDNFNKENRVTVVGAHGKKSTSYSTEEGSEQQLISDHAYTVKGSDKTNVYLINPHDTSKVITVPRDEFKKFFNTIDEFDL